MNAPARVEDLLRDEALRVLGALIRRYGQFDAAAMAPAAAFLAPEVVDGEPLEQDDTLTLLFMCCHPALSPASQLALTLRAVGGLTTAQIARAYMVPEATMGQRISRAKQSIRGSGIAFQMPPKEEWDERLRVVLHVLYLIFNEGYTATAGPELHQIELSGEAIRLARAVRRLLPDDGEVAGLLALMLLTDARRPARTWADGALAPLAEQDRSLWDRAAIREGTALITESLARAPLGPYQVQAAIAALHDEAASEAEIDWPQILALYGLLERLAPNPMVRLNRAVAVAMVHGPGAALDLLATLETTSELAGHHLLATVRGHLLEMADEQVAARASYLVAARQTISLPERRYLESRAARLMPGTGIPDGG